MIQPDNISSQASTPSPISSLISVFYLLASTLIPSRVLHTSPHIAHTHNIGPAQTKHISINGLLDLLVMTSETIDSFLAVLSGGNGKQPNLSRPDSQQVLDTLRESITGALSLAQFNQLVELVFNGPLPLPQKNFIVKHLLIPPRGTPETSIIFRIIGALGKPMRRLPTKFHSGIPITLQETLLKWLIGSVHMFDPAKSSSALIQLIPILFQSLIYEFLRPYVANLIFLSLVNDTKILIRGVPLRIWQLKLVIDLHFRFPLDDSLKALLVLFKWLDPSIDYNRYIPKGMAINLGHFSPSNLFTYPHEEHFQHLKQHKNHILQGNLKNYDRFCNVVTKKRKMINENTDVLDSGAIDLDLDVVDFSDSRNTNLVSIQEISSLKGLIEELENIQFVNIASLFKGEATLHEDLISNRYKLLFQVLRSGEQADRALLKVDYYLRLSLLDSNMNRLQLKLLVSKISVYLSFGNKVLPLLLDFMTKDISPLLPHPAEVFYERIKLLRYFPTPISNDLSSRFVAYVDEELKFIGSRQHLLAEFLEQLALALNAWYKSTTTTDLESLCEVYNLILPKLYTAFIKGLATQAVSTGEALALLQILRFIRSIDQEHLDSYIHASTITLPPSLVYALVLSSNPFVTSEICGFINHCKNFKFGTTGEDYKKLQNQYIMDILNFIWMDNAFKHEEESTSYNKAMMLHPEFIQQISISNAVAYSNMVQFPSIGNIFYNPSWATLTSEILRELEDAAGDTINTRHAGPPTQESVNRLLEDEDVKWLGVDYQELKVLVLRKLDQRGFTGLADLLFSSLKALASRRE